MKDRIDARGATVILPLFVFFAFSLLISVLVRFGIRVGLIVFFLGQMCFGEMILQLGAGYKAKFAAWALVNIHSIKPDTFGEVWHGHVYGN